MTFKELETALRPYGLYVRKVGRSAHGLSRPRDVVVDAETEGLVAVVSATVTGVLRTNFDNFERRGHEARTELLSILTTYSLTKKSKRRYGYEQQ